MKTYLPPEEFWPSWPRKVMGASVLCLDEYGRILIVRNVYQKDWSLPGGVVDADESPAFAAAREIREEIAHKVSPQDLRLITVTYQRANGVVPELMTFIFYGGILSRANIADIFYTDGEIDDHRFVTLSEALELVRPTLKFRLPHAIKAITIGGCAYLEI